MAYSRYSFTQVHPPDNVGSGIGTFVRTTMPQRELENYATAGTRGWLILAISSLRFTHQTILGLESAPLHVQLCHRRDLSMADSCYFFKQAHPPDNLGSGIGTFARTAMPQRGI